MKKPLLVTTVIHILFEAFFRPHFEEPIQNVTVPIGKSVGLKCIVVNLGEYKIAWVHVDRQMILTIEKKIITRIPRFSITYDGHNTWILHISNVQKVDEGAYMCQINTKPMLHQMGYLTVVVPPRIIDAKSSKSHVIAKEHSNVSLVCKAEGFPEPKIKWKKEDNDLVNANGVKDISIEGNTLRMHRVSREDMGAYLCIAFNGVHPSVSKRILLDIEFFPMVWIQNQLIGSPVGTDIALECETESYPKSINYWMREGNMIMNTKKYETIEISDRYKTLMKLVIQNLSHTDFGTYTCVAKNSLGTVNGIIRLYEVRMPSVRTVYHERKEKEVSDMSNFVRRKSSPDMGYEIDSSRINSAQNLNPEGSYSTSCSAKRGEWVLLLLFPFSYVHISIGL